jgi:hypothetical protein
VSRPLRVGLRTYDVVGWICVVVFLAGSAAAFFARQPGPSLGLGSFSLLGVLILCSSGQIIVGEKGVGHKNAFGRFCIDWDKIRRIEVGTYGTLILHGDDRRFALQPPTYWSGPEREAARQLLTTKLQSLGVPAVFCRTADYKIHRNARMSSDQAEWF